jgi:hypothetical protein
MSRSPRPVAPGQFEATSPLISSTLQVPQAPALHSYGRPTPARSAARRMVSSAAQENCAAPSASAME